MKIKVLNMNCYVLFYLFLFLNFNRVCNLENSCGNLGDNVPQSKEDCKSDDSDNCCFIHVPEKDISYCGSVPGKVTDDVKKEVKSVLSSNIGVSSIIIDCNFSVWISYSKIFYIVIFFFII